MKMEKENKFGDGGGGIVYTVRKSKRAKKARLAVYYDGRVVVTLPWRLREKFADKLITQKANWVLEKLANFQQLKSKGIAIPKHSKRDYLKHKQDALEFIGQRIDHLNQDCQFAFNRVNIKNQKTRWGSCSAKKNLNFNYKLLFLPQEIADYIIVHELCHLQELNHSSQFWNLVAESIPDYKTIKKQFKNKIFLI